MSSQCVKDLREVAKTAEENGFPVSANVCKYAADRMERMEKLIVSLESTISEEDL